MKKWSNSEISYLNSGKWDKSPSGIKIVPKFLPLADLTYTISARYSTTSFKCHPLARISSDIKVILGWVYMAHSKTKWEGSLPINLMKYQYLTAEAASIILFPIN